MVGGDVLLGVLDVVLAHAAARVVHQDGPVALLDGVLRGGRCRREGDTLISLFVVRISDGKKKTSNQNMLTVYRYSEINNTSKDLRSLSYLFSTTCKLYVLC